MCIMCVYMCVCVLCVCVGVHVYNVCGYIIYTYIEGQDVCACVYIKRGRGRGEESEREEREKRESERGERERGEREKEREERDRCLVYETRQVPGHFPFCLKQCTTPPEGRT